MRTAQIGPDLRLTVSARTAWHNDPLLCPKGRTIRKVMGGGWGIFEPQEFFFVIKFLVWIFLGHSMNIFSFNFPLGEYFVLDLAPPPRKFSYGPSLNTKRVANYESRCLRKRDSKLTYILRINWGLPTTDKWTHTPPPNSDPPSKKEVQDVQSATKLSETLRSKQHLIIMFLFTN